MQSPPVLDLEADRRVPFRRKLTFLGYDFSSPNNVLMQVRATKDTVGTPLISLSGVTGEVEGIGVLFAGTATIAQHIAAGRLDEAPEGYVDSDQILASQVSILISSTTMYGLPIPQERGDDLVLYYDLVWDSPAAPGDVYLRGRFIVRASVTIP